MELPFYTKLQDFENNFMLDYYKLQNEINYFEYLKLLISRYEEKYTNTNYITIKFDVSGVLQNKETGETEGSTRISNATQKVYRNEQMYEAVIQYSQIINFLKVELEKEIIKLQTPKIQPSDVAKLPEPEPYKEREKGVNVPYKLALLDELEFIKRLNRQYPNKSDIYRILQFLTGGNIDNIKDYYNSMYGNYSGSNQITHKHREKAKDLYYK